MNGIGTWFPFIRWNYYDGGRKFARNAPHMQVNEMDFGLEFARWTELELAMIYTRTFDRTRTSVFPYTDGQGDQPARRAGAVELLIARRRWIPQRGTDPQIAQITQDTKILECGWP